MVVQILQITSHDRTTGNTQTPRIFGLGSDSKVYEWNYTDGAWVDYKASS